MGYKISVNGKDMWESEGEGNLVDRVVVTNARGEVTTIGSPGTDDWLKIEVNIRDTPTDGDTYLDLQDADRLRERQERIEKASADAVAAGRRQMEEEAAEEERTGTEEESPEESPEFGPPTPVSTGPNLEL